MLTLLIAGGVLFVFICQLYAGVFWRSMAPMHSGDEATISQERVTTLHASGVRVDHFLSSAAHRFFDLTTPIKGAFNVSTAASPRLLASTDPDITQTLLDGLRRAELYNSNECLNLRSKQAFANWHKVTAETDSSYNSQIQSTFTLQASRVAHSVYDVAVRGNDEVVNLIYVGNQKAGSSTILNDGGHFFKAKQTTQCRWFRQLAHIEGPCERRAKKSGSMRSAVIRNNDIPFTFVGDPSHVFLSGIRQTLCDPNILSLNEHYPKGSMFNQDRPPLERLRKLLTALERGDFVNSMAFHALPQAFKIDVDFVQKGGLGSKTYAYIGTLDNLTSGVRALVPDALEPAHIRPLHSAKCARDIDSAVDNFTIDDLQRMCKLVSVDYVCFGFALPFWCK